MWMEYLLQDLWLLISFFVVSFISWSLFDFFNFFFVYAKYGLIAIFIRQPIFTYYNVNQFILVFGVVIRCRYI